MDYLQYQDGLNDFSVLEYYVLNLVINGLPSILGKENFLVEPKMRSFKPCYKWITFNTYSKTYI